MSLHQWQRKPSRAIKRRIWEILGRLWVKVTACMLMDLDSRSLVNLAHPVCRLTG